MKKLLSLHHYLLELKLFLKTNTIILLCTTHQMVEQLFTVLLNMPQVQRALEIVSALSTSKDNIAEKTETRPATPSKTSNSSKIALEGVPQSLLERVSKVIKTFLLAFVIAQTFTILVENDKYCMSKV